MPDNDLFNLFQNLIKKGDLVAIRKLVESGADINIQNHNGWTPLMDAAMRGRVSIIEYLLSKGADVKPVNTTDASALAYAALSGECRSIQILLDAGAPLDVRPHGVSLLEFVGWGKGRFRTQRHFKLLQSAGAK
jgi:ankyrin repeat protein